MTTPRRTMTMLIARRQADFASVAGLLNDPACPWSKSPCSPHGCSDLQIDRFLAFAFSRGFELPGLEETCDDVVRRLGGHRVPGRLPHYCFKG